MGARRVACLLAAAGMAGVFLAPAAPVAADDPVKIMIVGDSVAHGSTGDWTWRYRLWKHLEASGASVDFVGPRDDMYEMSSGRPGCHQYADPDFDTDHAAMWGATMFGQAPLIADLVREHEPDVIVETLGVNDLLWWSLDPGRLGDHLADFVAQARSAAPDVDVVVGDLPQEWRLGFSAVNDAIPGWAAELDTAESRVVPASTAEALVEQDTWDGLHLSASGEVKVAAGVADALARLGVGVPYPRPLPPVGNVPRRPAVLSASAGEGSAELSWQNPPGATAQYVWMKDTAADEPWSRLPLAMAETSWRAPGLRNYHEYSFRLQAMKGSAVVEDVFSDTVSVTPAPPAPPAVEGLEVVPRSHKLRVRWSPVTPATGYALRWWPGGHKEQVRTVDTADTKVVLPDLIAGRTYRLTVAAVNDLVVGPVVRALAAPTGPVTKGPRRLEVRALPLRRYRLTWRPRPRATRYEVWHRTPGASWERLGWRKVPKYRTEPLAGGKHAFRVRSWHQRIPGGWSETVRARG